MEKKKKKKDVVDLLKASTEKTQVPTKGCTLKKVCNTLYSQDWGAPRSDSFAQNSQV